MRRWIYVVFIPVLLGAVSFLGYSSFTTTLDFERWGMRSIVDSTYLVAREKAERIEQKIIDSDNAILSLVDVSNLQDLGERWQQLATISHAVDSVFVLDGNLSIVFKVSNYSEGELEALSAFFQKVIVPRLELKDGKTTTLRHLHMKHEGKYYLFSYRSVKHDDAWYTVCLGYNMEYLKGEFLAEMLSDLAPSKLYNVVDSEGNLVYGTRMKEAGEAGEFIVGWRIPSTLYEWRIQVAPTQAAFYEAKSRRKHLYDIITSGIAFGVVFLGIGMLIYMAEQERRLSKLKSEFIANVSHELKTPLSIIRLFSDMLAMGKIKDAEKERRYLDIISREGERLTSLIDGVLDFSKIEGGKLAYNLVVGDVSAAVGSAIEISRFKLQQERMEVLVDIEEGLPPVSHDPHAITLAVVNLLDNAAKYAEGSEAVWVSVRRSNGKVAISVRDRGPGIPKVEQRHIFDRFYRGEKAKGKHKRGTGIGLTLVKSIIESHGGKVQVRSPTEESGRGTEFLITLDPV